MFKVFFWNVSKYVPHIVHNWEVIGGDFTKIQENGRKNVFFLLKCKKCGKLKELTKDFYE